MISADPAVDEWREAAGYFAAGRFDESRLVLAGMLKRNPDNPQAWLALAQVNVHAGSVQKAFESAFNAFKLAPPDAKLLCDIATTLLMVGAGSAARECTERAASLEPRDAAVQQRIAMHYQNINEHDSALAWMERARLGGLDDPPTRFCLAVQLMFHGRMREAEIELEACAVSDPPLGKAMAQLSQIRKWTAHHNHLEMLARQLARSAAGSESHAALQFARYKEFEDLGRYEDAWISLAEANATMRTLLRHDPIIEQHAFDALVECVDGMPISPGKYDSGQEGPTPIFIVGMPRSGTTLLDRMLGNHSEVRSAGELGTFRRSLERMADCFTGHMLDETMVARLPAVDYAELGNLYLANSQWLARGRRFFIDKLPRNWLLVPLIRRALPRARILHMVRSPMATAFSNLRSYFGGDYPYCYDINSLALHYQRYRKMMAHWHAVMPSAICDVSYENLVADPGAEMRKVFDYCGLPWEPGCDDLARNREPVATLSAAQVRGSIDPLLSERWRHYATHLSSLERMVTEADAPSGPVGACR